MTWREWAEAQAAEIRTAGRWRAPRDLDAVLRAEYRTKLLNPKWAEAMVAQGSGGAYEVRQRFTAMVGWGGTSGFRDKWAWDQAARTYALDEGMASRLLPSNTL